MKKQKLREKDSLGIAGVLLVLILFAVVFAVVLTGLYGASDNVSHEGVRVAREAIVRGAVSCYAIEGAYPESYEYLRDNYDIAVNENKYIVHYTIFASNIMPEITVVARGDG